MELSLIRDLAANCEQCELYKGRIKPVFDKGNPHASIFICGMVPAKDENEAGLPFVGRAGKLLDVILDQAELTYDQVYITNLVKCFVAAGKSLKQDWVDSCLPYLVAQIAELKPKYIITLGMDASSALIGEDFKALSSIQGVVHKYTESIGLVPTYHPSYLLRTGGQLSPKFNTVVKHFEKVRNMCYF